MAPSSNEAQRAAACALLLAGACLMVPARAVSGDRSLRAHTGLVVAPPMPNTTAHRDELALPALSEEPKEEEAAGEKKEGEAKGEKEEVETKGDKKEDAKGEKGEGESEGEKKEDAKGEPEQKVEAGEKEDKARGWSHEAPESWKDGYPDCDGKMQSPVNITTGEVETKSDSNVTYLQKNTKYKAVADCEIKNNGHSMQVDGDFGILVLPDGDYEASQFHFHFPSEHMINGKPYTGEIQIVHQRAGANGTEDLAVIGILLDEAEVDLANPKDAKKELAFMKQLGFGKQLPSKGETMQVKGKVDLGAFGDLLKQGFWHYQGSLTTPPCSETVHWYVLQQVAVVSPEMVKMFAKEFPKGNNRPVQPLNGREVVFSEVALPGEFDVDGNVTGPVFKATRSGAARVGAIFTAALASICLQAWA